MSHETLHPYSNHLQFGNGKWGHDERGLLTERIFTGRANIPTSVRATWLFSQARPGSLETQKFRA